MNLAAHYNDCEDYARAEPLNVRALEGMERVLEPEHRHTLTCIYNLANLYTEIGDYEQAEDLFIRGLAASERLPEPGFLDYVRGLAGLYTKNGRLEDAISLRRRVFHWYREQKGDDDLYTLMSLNELAIVLREAGQLAEAEVLFEELVATKNGSLSQAF